MTKHLTAEDALDIYQRCHEGEKQSSIAIDYDCSQATISGIKRGIYWSRVTGHPRTRPMSPRQLRIIDVYSAYWDDKLPVKVIAPQYGLSLKAVYDILKGRTGAYLTGHPIHPSATAQRQA